jgi:cell wall-associated NlpC family hydrolase
VFCINSNVYAKTNSANLNKDLEQAYNLLIVKAPGYRAASKNSNKHLSVVKHAKNQIHKKYRCGGSSPQTGFDCSGLMQYAYKSAKINLPRTATEQYKATKRVPIAKMKIDDLIFFHTRRTRARVNHVGLYLGSGKFIHAPRKGKRVSIANLSHYWLRKAIGAGRV